MFETTTCKKQTTITTNNNNNASGAPGGVEKQISSYTLPCFRGEEKETHKQSVVGTNNKKQTTTTLRRTSNFEIFCAERGEKFLNLKQTTKNKHHKTKNKKQTS